MKGWDQLRIKNIWDHSLTWDENKTLSGTFLRWLLWALPHFLICAALVSQSQNTPEQPEWKQCKVWVGDLFHCQLSPPACGISSFCHTAAGCQKPWPLVSSSHLAALLRSDLTSKKSCTFLFGKKTLVQFSTSCSYSFSSLTSTSTLNIPVVNFSSDWQRKANYIHSFYIPFSALSKKPKL